MPEMADGRNIRARAEACPVSTPSQNAELDERARKWGKYGLSARFVPSFGPVGNRVSPSVHAFGSGPPIRIPSPSLLVLADRLTICTCTGPKPVLNLA